MDEEKRRMVQKRDDLWRLRVIAESMRAEMHSMETKVAVYKQTIITLEEIAQRIESELPSKEP